LYGAGGGPFPFGQGMGEGPRGGGGVWREPGLRARPPPNWAGGRLRRPAAGRAVRARRPPVALRPYGADGFYILPVAGKEEILYDRIA